MTEAALGVRDPATLKPDQRIVYDKIANGPRGSVPKPFYAMLDAPILADAIQQVGATLRYHSTLRDDHREVAILSAAGAVGSGYEWGYHAPIAAGLGVPAEVIDATWPEATTLELAAPWKTIVDLCRALVARRDADQHLLDEAIAQFGRQGATELIAIAGYYPLLATFLKCGRLDLPFEESLRLQKSASA